MSDQVDTLRERIEKIRDLYEFEGKTVKNSAQAVMVIDTFLDRIEALCQGVAKEARQQAIASYKKANAFHENEARLDELKRIPQFEVEDESGNAVKHVLDRIAELTGNKPGLLASSETPTADTNKADNPVEQFTCQSYYGDDGHLYKCTCGKCELGINDEGYTGSQERI